MVQTHTRSSAQPKTEAAVGAVAAAAASAVAAAAAAATTKSVRSFYSRRAGELRARTRSRAHIVNADPQRCYLSRKAVEHGYHKISSYAVRAVWRMKGYLRLRCVGGQLSHWAGNYAGADANL